jgi:hypothetical protein
MELATAKQIISFITEESSRIGFGKLFIEVTVAKGRATNIQAETKRSMNLNSERSE